MNSSKKKKWLVDPYAAVCADSISASQWPCRAEWGDWVPRRSCKTPDRAEVSGFAVKKKKRKTKGEKMEEKE